MPLRRGLRLDEIGDLLEYPLIAVLATIRADGGILLSPVWQEWREGGFNLFSAEGDVKIRHLRADPRATVVVFESIPPYRGVEVRGTARLSTDNARETAERIAARFEEADPDEDTLPPECVVIRLEPGTMRVWDYADEF
jgi:PPOX class probable F420-dependent enzyme